MRKNGNLLRYVIVFAAATIVSLVVTSCARMGNPDGGWYDDTPPRVISSSPSDMGTNVKSKRVSINFNEFIKIDDPQSKVVVSPPQLEVADIKTKGKKIVVDLQDSLKANTTYTIDFSDAISDNNEGNPMGNYTFSFSTGSTIDTLVVSGYVLDAETLEPVKDILVGLYTDSTFADSTFHTIPMERISRTNGSGFFAIKGVAEGRYRIRALKDGDGDFVHAQKSEVIAFNDSVITPTVGPDTRQDTVWKDPLHIDKVLTVEYIRFRPDDVTLLSFQAPQTDRYFLKTERKDPEKIGLFFTYGHDSLPEIRGLNFDSDSAFVIEASEKRDTIYYWLRDTALIHQDTLRFEMRYEMTDSTGMLVAQTDTIEALPKIPYAKRLKAEQKDFEKWQKEQEKKKKNEEPFDSIMPAEHLKVKLSASGMLDPNQNVYFEFQYPLDSIQRDSIHLYSMIDSVWYRAPFVFEQVNLRTYVMKAEWRSEVEYSLECDTLAFTDIYGKSTKPIKQGLRVRKDDDFATLFVNLTSLPDSGDVIIQLLDGSDKVIREQKAEDNTAEFFYLKPGKFYMRAFVDWNHNGKWDTGDYDAHLQPEPTYYYAEELECKAKWDMTREWNLTRLPIYKQKPLAITKQKPDKKKELKNRNAQRAADKGVPVPEGL